jgi:hypothetical protein
MLLVTISDGRHSYSELRFVKEIVIQKFLRAALMCLQHSCYISEVLLDTSWTYSQSHVLLNIPADMLQFSYRWRYETLTQVSGNFPSLLLFVNQESVCLGSGWWNFVSHSFLTSPRDSKDTRGRITSSSTFIINCVLQKQLLLFP